MKIEHAWPNRAVLSSLIVAVLESRGPFPRTRAAGKEGRWECIKAIITPSEGLGTPFCRSTLHDCPNCLAHAFSDLRQEFVVQRFGGVGRLVVMRVAKE